jgi:UDP-galactopyranose mutase
VESYLKKFEDIKERFQDTGVNAENISIILLAIMMEANTMTKLTGHEKKSLVTKLITHIALDLCTNDEQPTLRQLIQTMVPTLIDNFIEVGKGVVNLKKIKVTFPCCT